MLSCEALTWQVTPEVLTFTLQPQETLQSTSPVSEGCPNQSVLSQHPAYCKFQSVIYSALQVADLRQPKFYLMRHNILF